MKEYGPKEASVAVVGCSKKDCRLNEAPGWYIKNIEAPKNIYYLRTRKTVTMR